MDYSPLYKSAAGLVSDWQSSLASISIRKHPTIAPPLEALTSLFPLVRPRKVTFHKTLYLLLAACIVIFGTAGLYVRHDEATNGFWRGPTSPFGRRRAPPDPTKQPGWREGTKWISSDTDNQLHHWLQRMSDKEDGDHMDWARNKTILLLGDSVLRDLVWRLCDKHLHVPKREVQLNETLKKSEKTSGWECVVPQTNTTLINGFIYGMTNYSRFDTKKFVSHEWPPGPWGFEDRVPELVRQYERYKPSMVVLNSGPWDFKFMYRRDIYEGRRAPDIDTAELREYGERLRQCLRMLRAAYPRSKLAFLQVYPFAADDVKARWAWAKGMHGGHDTGIDFSPATPDAAAVRERLPDLFTRRRVGQLAATYRRVVQEESLDDLDYWKIAEATEPGEFIRKGDAIHPADLSIAVMLDWVLEKLWRWEVYRV